MDLKLMLNFPKIKSFKLDLEKYKEIIKNFIKVTEP